MTVECSEVNSVCKSRLILFQLFQCAILVHVMLFMWVLVPVSVFQIMAIETRVLEWAIAPTFVEVLTWDVS